MHRRICYKDLNGDGKVTQEELLHGLANGLVAMMAHGGGSADLDKDGVLSLTEAEKGGERQRISLERIMKEREQSGAQQGEESP